MSKGGPTAQERWNRVIASLTRIFVWVTIALTVYLLRSFFLLVFLTFVLSYIQALGNNALKDRIPHRTLRVWVVLLLLISAIVGTGAFILPRAKEQATLFVEHFPDHLRTIDKELLKVREKNELLTNFMPSPESLGTFPPTDARWTPKTSFTAGLFQQATGSGESAEGSQSLKKTVAFLGNIGGTILGSLSAFLLALLFSFLIVLDLDRLTASVRGLRNTKLKFVYDDVAHSIYEFGIVLGRALGAQLVIAICNTILTALFLWIIGLGDRLAFLSIIVFLCSFIPVAGVILSSLPICLMVLQSSGFGMVIVTGLAIWIIHMIEAYVLNPRIFGHHLRINPVLVLIILTVAGKLFGVWGLVLGLPVCTYIFGHAIRGRSAVES